MGEPSDPSRPAFSDELAAWLGSPGPKTLEGLGEVFGPRSFAVAVVVLMLLPALPLPTGGVSHLFELVVIVLGAEMALGRTTLWLPERWRTRPLAERTLSRALPAMVRRVRSLERISRPRGAGLLARRATSRLYGVAFVVLAAFAALAPPFSGLDTLPAMGAVVLGLSLLLGDVVLALLGLALGLAGIALVLTVGVAAYELVVHFFA
jgi:hypothetical protein